MTKIVYIHIILIILCALVTAQDNKADGNSNIAEKYKKAFELVKFPSEKEYKKYLDKGGYDKKVIQLVLGKDIWVEAFQKIDGKVGLFKESVPINVLIKEKIGAPAQGGSIRIGKDVRGHIEFSVYDMGQAIQIYERIEKSGIKGASATDPRRAIFHELTHVFQSVIKSGIKPDWLSEGMATYVEDDMVKVLSYRDRFINRKVPAIDENISLFDSYPRGWLLFKYMEVNYGVDKVHEFSKVWVVKGKTYREALETATTKKWDEVKKEEQEWSTKYLKELKE